MQYTPVVTQWWCNIDHRALLKILHYRNSKTEGAYLMKLLEYILGLLHVSCPKVVGWRKYVLRDVCSREWHWWALLQSEKERIYKKKFRNCFYDLDVLYKKKLSPRSRSMLHPRVTSKHPYRRSPPPDLPAWATSRNSNSVTTLADDDSHTTSDWVLLLLILFP